MALMTGPTTKMRCLRIKKKVTAKNLTFRIVTNMRVRKRSMIAQLRRKSSSKKSSSLKVSRSFLVCMGSKEEWNVK